MKLLLFALTCIFFTGCAKFVDTGESVWGEGMWIAPTLTFLGACWFGYKAYKASKSNSTQQSGLVTTDNTGNVPIYKSGFFWFSVGLLIATIVIIIMRNSDK